MQGNSLSPSLRVREGDTIETEWSQVSYDGWCREQAQQFVTTPGLKVVDIYAVVRSVIEKDLSQAEREITLLRRFNNLSVRKIAARKGTSVSNVYSTLERAEEKIRLVLKHLVVFEDYTVEKDDFYE